MVQSRDGECAKARGDRAVAARTGCTHPRGVTLNRTTIPDTLNARVLDSLYTEYIWGEQIFCVRTGLSRVCITENNSGLASH